MKRSFFAGLVIVGVLMAMVLATGVSAMPPATNDWPMFQGNLEHSGVAYPGTWGIDTPIELWKYTTDNQISSSSPTLADIDGDGKLETIVGTANFAGTGGIYAVKADGSLKWKYATGDYGTYATAPLADIDGDGKLETVFASYAGKIIALEDDGTEKWKLDKGFRGTQSIIADVNGDGVLEIAVGAASKIWLLKADGTELWNRPFAVGTAIAIADVDGDGGLEIIFSALGSRTIVALNADGSTQWTTSAVGDDFQVSLAVMNDVNSDSKRDVVAGCRDKRVYAYSGADGSLLWSDLTVGRVFGIAVADVNSDGTDDVVATATRGDGVESYVYVLNGTNGNLLWKHNVVGAKAYTTAPTPAIVDVNKDGVLDVLVASQNKNFYALSGVDGSEIWAFACGRDASAPAIADINGDRVTDIVFAAGNTVYAITGPIVEVTIDIKPGSDPNSINLKSKGVVPVAVLTTATFDASTIDPSTVKFAGAPPVRWTLEDVDGDGDLDMLFHFDTEKLTELNENSTSATLIGATTTGTPIKGTDTVKIVPKGK